MTIKCYPIPYLSLSLWSHFLHLKKRHQDQSLEATIIIFRGRLNQIRENDRENEPNHDLYLYIGIEFYEITIFLWKAKNWKNRKA